MYTTRTLIPTLRDDPGEAEIVSHRLMLRAGMIRKVAAGVYSYLPLGLRVIRKIEGIIRSEMNAAGAQEVLLPILAPAELWQETDRWGFYGKELMRLQDRHGRDFCLGPTHEEIVTDLCRREVRSYRQLPVTLYQIQNKFRDEIRPRFGVMRGREFLMKDAYSFDTDEDAARASYQQMYNAYERIFSRTGLTFRAVQADTGLIGGTSSHEFMVLAQTGEELIVFDPQSSYAANVERAEVVPDPNIDNIESPATAALPLESIHTPGARTVDEVCAQLSARPEQLVKTLLYETSDRSLVAVLIRGDHQANEIKIQRHLGIHDLALATPEAVQAATAAPPGFAGPVGLSGVTMLADHAVRSMNNMIVGANKADTHFRNANLDRDVTVDTFGDFRQAQAGDRSPASSGTLETARGIEVGHVFMLGTKYSERMGASYLDTEGRERPAVMGCYGIGVSRTMAAAIEQNHDEHGIIWPIPIAPFHVHLLPVTKSDQVAATTRSLYEELTRAHIEVLVDDRDERAGVKFNDADLIGAPFHVTIGSKGLAAGAIDVKDRRTGAVTKVSPDALCGFLQERLSGEIA